MSYNNIGTVYFAMRQYKLAAENYQKALSLMDQAANDREKVAVILNNIAGLSCGKLLLSPFDLYVAFVILGLLDEHFKEIQRKVEVAEHIFC